MIKLTDSETWGKKNVEILDEAMGDVKTVLNGKHYDSFSVDTKIIPCNSKHVYMDELVEVIGTDSQNGISQRLSRSIRCK